MRALEGPSESKSNSPGARRGKQKDPADKEVSKHPMRMRQVILRGRNLNKLSR